MRKLIVILAIAALIAAFGPGSASSHHVPAKTRTVKVLDDEFSPTKKTIHLKDIVKWVWSTPDGKPGTTANEHTVTDTKGKWDSGEKTSGTFRRRFKKVGTFRVYCLVHPDTMRMKIVVKD